MASKKEYRAFRIFEGKGWPARPPVTRKWYTEELSKFLSTTEMAELITDLVAKGFLELIGEHQSAKLTPAGWTYYDGQYYHEQAYDIVDECLRKIQYHNDGIDTSHRSQRIQNLAESLMEDNFLVRYLSYPKNVAMVTLLEEGHQVIEEGGIRAYLRHKVGVDKQEADMVFKWIRERAPADRAYVINLQETSTAVDLGLISLKNVLDFLEKKGQIEQGTWVGDAVRAITLVKGSFGERNDLQITRNLTQNFNSGIVNNVVGSSNVSLSQDFTNVGNAVTGVENEENKKLISMQLEDLPKNSRYRKWGLWIAIIAAGLLILFWIIDKFWKK